MLKTYPKESNDQLSLHFNVSEFTCRCKVCESTLIDSDLIDKLEAFREAAGFPLKITSGYRCENYQNELRLRGYETAVGVSQHTLGRASDVMRADAGSVGLDLEKLARSVGFMAVGVAPTWVHVDLRNDRDRHWTYTN